MNLDLETIKLNLHPSARTAVHLRGRPRQMETVYRLNEVMRGSATYRFDHKNVTVKSGDFIFLKPGWRALTCHPVMDIFSTRFDLSGTSALDTALESLADGTVFAGATKDKEVLKNALKNARDEMALDRHKERAKLQLKIALSFFIKEKRPTAGRPPPPKKLTELAGELTLHPEKRMAVSEMAAFAGCSERQLRRLFMTFYSMSPSDFAVHQRIRHAQELLLHEAASVKDAAYSLGYPDPYSFSKQFKKIVRVSPLRYLENS